MEVNLNRVTSGIAIPLSRLLTRLANSLKHPSLGWQLAKRLNQIRHPLALGFGKGIQGSPGLNETNEIQTAQRWMHDAFVQRNFVSDGVKNLGRQEWKPNVVSCCINDNVKILDGTVRELDLVAQHVLDVGLHLNPPVTKQVQEV